MLGRSRTISGAARPGLAVPVALLVLALALVGTLAWKAQAAARSHRAAAERALRDYAKFAAWQFAERARLNLLTTTVSSMLPPLTTLDPDRPDATLPTPADFARSAHERLRLCDCLGHPRLFFRYDWRTGELATAPALDSSGAELAVAPTAGELRWLRDTVAAHLRRFRAPAGMAPLAFGTTPRGGGLRRLSVVITNDAYVNLYGTVDGEARVLAYVLSRTSDGRPYATFGWESDAAGYAAPALGAVVERERLLPPSLTGALPNDSLLSVAVRDRAGHVLWRSAARYPLAYAARDTLEPVLGGLDIEVAINPRLAGALVVGGLPRTQLPLLLALVALTAGLLLTALVQLRRQQQLARLRTDFVSGVSHELRTPLTQIRLFAELLHGDKLRNDADRRRAARILDQEARRLAYLVENVLAFSRADRRANHVSPEPVAIDTEIRDTLDLATPIAAARGVHLHAVLEEGVVAVVDPGALRQVLLNLLDNAVKYGPEGQAVTVGARLAGNALRLWVEDHGPGIPAAERERVFEPYHRLTRDAMSAIGGSGIGLAVVHEIVTLHEGRTWVEEAEGGGTRVVVELPVAGPAARVAPHLVGEPPLATDTLPPMEEVEPQVLDSRLSAVATGEYAALGSRSTALGSRPSDLGKGELPEVIGGRSSVVGEEHQGPGAADHASTAEGRGPHVETRRS